MKAMACVLWLAVFLIVAGAAAAGDKPRSENPTGEVQPASHVVSPWISSTMPENLREKLEFGFDLAVERVRDVPECSDLFSDIGVDGVEVLKTTLYYPASAIQEREMCGDCLGFAVPGAAQTWLCRKLSKYPSEVVARVVVNEALHRAGLQEKSADYGQLTGNEMREIVSRACGL